jgi:hypothetical protein
MTIIDNWVRRMIWTFQLDMGKFLKFRGLFWLWKDNGWGHKKEVLIPPFKFSTFQNGSLLIKMPQIHRVSLIENSHNYVRINIIYSN